MKKKLSILITICMVISLIPASAFAASGTHMHSDIGEFKALPAEGGRLAGNYYVDGITYVKNTIVVEKGDTLTICLNGSSLYRDFSGTLIKNDGVLNIITCSDRDISNWYTDSGHSEEEYYSMLSWQGAIKGKIYTKGNLIETSGEVNLNRGSIAFSEGEKGGLVTVLPGGSFNMNGGSLNSGFATNGGLINNEGGKVTINDGILVCGMSSSSKGGAIYNNGELNLLGGSFIENSAVEGGAIYHAGGNLNLKGTLDIKNNFYYSEQDSSNSNIYIENGANINILGSVRGYAGIKSACEGAIARGADGYTLTKLDAESFKTDNNEYKVFLDESTNSLIYDKNDGTIITTQPKDINICEYERGSFEVEADNVVSYQWQKSKDGGITWSNKSGATKATYTTGKSTIKSDGNMYRCVLKDSKGITTISKEVKLNVAFREPLPCRIVRCADNNGKAVIRWAKDIGYAPQGYRVYRSENKDSGFKPIKNKNGWVKTGSGKTLTDYNVKEGKTYYYKVKPYIKNSLNKCVFGSDLIALKVVID